eukprot:gnl/TRDRNA2_/TRDRNA2_55727_c0_seq2.p1 gnl/TRDRNA2_/TRDRNA2_55727_c0~~gnl/TRDRNA2_/TRDRNA2_55727_c0_seq2.p1  ORF type:complete len:223 (+),score=27.93 gnl/TRDRNA2_/TRDRNA2_55727_c0_seq2:102-770(+)
MAKAWEMSAARVKEDFSNLHEGSAWLKTKDQYASLVLDAVGLMDPPLKDSASIFEVGVGTGASLAVLRGRWPNLTVGGSDLSEPAASVARRVFPRSLIISPHRMQDHHVGISDNSFDHVISVGAVGQYAKKWQMTQAVSEMVRMVKGGGSIVFTTVPDVDAPPDSLRFSEVVARDFWTQMASQLGLESVKTARIFNDELGCYAVAGKKKTHVSKEVFGVTSS